MADYPICLNNMDCTMCIVVGGGDVAARKVQSLLEVGAKVRVISPQLEDGLQRLADQGFIEHVPRQYQEGDLDGCILVIAATDSRAVNRAVSQEAESLHCLVNVVDDAELSNCTVPAVMRRGPLTISISTGGQSPALAAHMRRDLEGLIGPEYATFTEILGELREHVAMLCPAESRRAMWYLLIESDILRLVKDGHIQAARDRARELVDSFIADTATSSG